MHGACFFCFYAFPLCELVSVCGRSWFSLSKSGVYESCGFVYVHDSDSK